MEGDDVGHAADVGGAHDHADEGAQRLDEAGPGHHQRHPQHVGQRPAPVVRLPHLEHAQS